MCFCIGCEGLYEFELPEANSKEDTVLPSAGFTYAADPMDFTIVKFNNLSFEATTFLWDFGGGNTSTEEDPTFTFAAEGTYPVTLTASDARGASDMITVDVIVAPGPYQPFLLEAGFEDNTLPDGSGDGRFAWRTNTYAPSNWATIFGITSGPTKTGNQAAKLELNSPRAGYQEFIVEPNSTYDIGFWYTITPGSSDPWAIMSVVGVTANGPITSQQQAIDGTIASVTVTNDEDRDTYIEAGLTFDSGDNNVVAIYFYNNGGSEVRIDDVTIDIGVPGPVPPSPGFEAAQSATDYLEYSFTNSSINAVSYEWDFGDGNTSTEASPTHVYATHNVYTVTLTAKSEGGLTQSLSKTIDIQAPVSAEFTFMKDAMDYKTYYFTDASEDAVMLLWEFGDGYQFTGMNPTHTYAEDGVYTVTLTAYSITGLTDVATEMVTVADGFIVQVLNGTIDIHTGSTGDNADSWDMTPNSTILDDDGNTIPSPYRPLWNNTALNTYIDATYCTNEQVSTTSDGAFLNGSKTRGAKIGQPCRRLYQVVQVEAGVDYTFSIDTRSEAMGVNTEVFLLNTEIETEVGIDASKTDPAIDAYYEITNDFNSDKSMFTTTTFTFTPSTNKIVIYVRSLDAVDSSNEVFLDNVAITAN